MQIRTGSAKLPSSPLALLVRAPAGGIDGLRKRAQQVAEKPKTAFGTDELALFEHLLEVLLPLEAVFKEEASLAMILRTHIEVAEALAAAPESSSCTAQDGS